MRSFNVVATILGIGLSLNLASFSPQSAQTQNKTSPKGADLAATMKLAPLVIQGGDVKRTLDCTVTDIGREKYDGHRTVIVKLVIKTEKSATHTKVLVTHKVPPLAPGKSYTFQVPVPAADFGNAPADVTAEMIISHGDSNRSNDKATVRLVSE